MSTFLLWFQALRPKTFIISASPIFLGSVFALTQGSFHPLILLYTLCTTFSIQIGSHFANDYFDFLKGADLEDRKGPSKLLTRGLTTPRIMFRAMMIAFCSAVLFCIPLIAIGGLPIAYLLALSILMGIIYTAGPFSLAYLGLGDFFAFLFYGPIAVLFTAYLQTKTFSLTALLCGIGPGAFSTMIYLLNNLRDEDNDRKAHKKTVIVRFGKAFGKIEYLFLFSLLLLLPCFLSWKLFIAHLALIPLFPFALSNFQTQKAEDFERAFKKHPKALLLYTFLLSVGFIL